MRVALVIIVLALMVVLGIGAIRLIIGSFSGGSVDIGGTFRAGTDGGVYVSHDRGETFQQSAQAGETSFARYDVFSVLEDPYAPETWWVATEGAGLYRSSDNGATWEKMNGPEDILAKAIIRSFVIGKEGTMFLALDAGGRGRIWKSSDRGETFREVYSAARNGVTVQAIAIPRQDTNVVLAGLSDGLLIGSTDEGESWTKLSQFTGSLSSITFAPSDPAIVYGIVDRVGAVRSRDRGVTWEELTRLTPDPKAPKTSAQRLATFPGGRAVYAIAVHPTNPNEILLATASGLLRSQDGGVLFTQLPVPLKPEALPVRSAAFDPSNPAIIHTTAGDGVYTSFDGGMNWRVTRLTIRPKLALIRVSVADGNTILIGTADR